MVAASGGRMGVSLRRAMSTDIHTLSREMASPS